MVRLDRVNLIAEMARKTMTLAELAEKSGVNVYTISGVRNGKSCTQETAAKLAQGLGVPLETILEKEA